MLIHKMLEKPAIGLLIRHRFFKFSIVGFAGVFVNLICLYLGQEFIFGNVYPEILRLNLSLGLAVFVATLNNFFWNRAWTWGDRKGKTKYGLIIQMGQFFIANGLSIGLQFAFTMVLTQFVHYLISNFIAIILAAILSYILNDIWTFSIKPSQNLK